MCSNDTYWGPQSSCTDGQVAAIQSNLVFLSSCLTSAEVSQPKKTVSTQQSLIQILDYLTPSAVYLDPHFASLHFFSCLACYTCNHALQQWYTIQFFLVSTTGPPSYEVFLSHPWFGVPPLIFEDPFLPLSSSPGSHFQDKWPQTWTLSSDGKKQGESVSDSLEANITMFNNWESN